MQVKKFWRSVCGAVAGLLNYEHVDYDQLNEKAQGTHTVLQHQTSPHGEVRAPGTFWLKAQCQHTHKGSKVTRFITYRSCVPEPGTGWLRNNSK